MGLKQLKDRINTMIRGDQEMKTLGKELQKEYDMTINLHIEIVEAIQTKYPHLIVTGSTALFLHGVRLKRWLNAGSDIDIVSPYFTELNGDDIPWDEVGKLNFEDFKVKGSIDELIDSKKPFHYKKSINGKINLEMRIEPTEPYEIVEYQDTKYKVAKLENIIFAKMLYARDGNQKHIDDIYEICGKKIKEEPKPSYSWMGS